MIFEFCESFVLTRKLSQRKQGTLKPPVRLSTLIAMNIPLLPLRSRLHLFPKTAFWLKALCLIPLAMPIVRVVLSGFSWFGWLNFPFSWLAATGIIVMLHILLPMAIVAGIYWGVRSIWSAKTTFSQALWFACSTMLVAVVSFCGTVAIAALAESTICRMPTATILVGGSCSNHFANTDLTDVISSMETYDLRYYTWMLWLMLIAYCYQAEAYFWERTLPIIDAFDTYQQEDEDMGDRFSHEDVPSLDVMRPVTDGDVLEGSPNL
jgi:hypothetical protein